MQSYGLVLEFNAGMVPASVQFSRWIKKLSSRMPYLVEVRNSEMLRFTMAVKWFNRLRQVDKAARIGSTVTRSRVQATCLLLSTWPGQSERESQTRPSAIVTCQRRY